MNDKEFCNAIHMEIHAIRRIQNYKPNPSEVNISRLVLDKFENSCKECKDIKESIKNKKPEKSFLSKLGGMMDGD